MKPSLRASAHGIALGAVGLLLAACGSAGTGLTPSATAPASGAAGMPPTLAMRMASSAGLAAAGHSKLKHSWMSPLAKKVHPLLYTSDALTDQVDIYGANGKNNTLMGQLTGFSEPYGVCTDKSGNVYITNLQGNDILEYAHGGTSLLKTVNDPYGNPGGCSVNPKTGDLAVTNFEGDASGYGNLVVYASASGTGTEYSIAPYYYAYAPVYDKNGNLVFETENFSSRQVNVYELPNGSSNLATITLPAGVTIYSPSGATWDGKDVGLTDEQYQNGSTEGIYRVSISGTTAKLVGQAGYADPCYYGFSTTVQPIVYKNMFIGGNIYCGDAGQYHIDYWNYKKGGSPLRFIDASAQQDTSYGQAISK